MSIFSEKLKEFTEQKNKPVYVLAKYCHMDRSNMYKIVHGTRHPSSIAVVENLAQALTLTPYEKSQLLQAWHITELGEYIYYERKLVSAFISGLKADRNYLASESFGNMEQSVSTLPKEDTVIYGKNSLNSCIKNMIEEETGKESPVIRLICQPEQSFLFHLLATYGSSESLEIRHLICMESLSEKQENRYNLQCLNAMAPLLIASCRYQVHYYYDTVQSHFHNMNLLPCMLLTGNQVLLMTADFDQGLLLTSKDIVHMYCQLFEKYMKETKELFQDWLNFPELIDEFEKSKNHYVISILSPAPISGAIPAELCFKYMKQEGSYQDLQKTFINDTLDYAQKCMLEGKYTNFFTEEGVRDFMDHGHIVDATSDYYHTFQMEDRIQVLRNMVGMLKLGCPQGHLIKPGFLDMQRDFYMTIYDTGRTDILFRNANHQWRLISIVEKSLGDSFFNFTRYLTENPEVCSQEESLAVMENLLKEYEEK